MRAPRTSLHPADPGISNEILTQLLGTHAFDGSPLLRQDKRAAVYAR